MPEAGKRKRSSSPAEGGESPVQAGPSAQSKKSRLNNGEASDAAERIEVVYELVGSEKQCIRSFGDKTLDTLVPEVARSLGVPMLGLRLAHVRHHPGIEADVWDDFDLRSIRERAIAQDSKREVVRVYSAALGQMPSSPAPSLISRISSSSASSPAPQFKQPRSAMRTPMAGTPKSEKRVMLALPTDSPPNTPSPSPGYSSGASPAAGGDLSKTARARRKKRQRESLDSSQANISSLPMAFNSSTSVPTIQKNDAAAKVAQKYKPSRPSPLSQSSPVSEPKDQVSEQKAAEPKPKKEKKTKDGGAATGVTANDAETPGKAQTTSNVATLQPHEQQETRKEKQQATETDEAAKSVATPSVEGTTNAQQVENDKDRKHKAESKESPKVAEKKSRKSDPPAKAIVTPLDASSLPPAAGSLPPKVGSLPPSVGSLPPSVGSLPPSVGSLPPSVGSLPSTVTPIDVPPPSETTAPAATPEVTAAAVLAPATSTPSATATPESAAAPSTKPKKKKKKQDVSQTTGDLVASPSVPATTTPIVDNAAAPTAGPSAPANDMSQGAAPTTPEAPAAAESTSGSASGSDVECVLCKGKGRHAPEECPTIISKDVELLRKLLGARRKELYAVHQIRSGKKRQEAEEKDAAFDKLTTWIERLTKVAAKVNGTPGKRPIAPNGTPASAAPAPAEETLQAASKPVSAASEVVQTFPNGATTATTSVAPAPQAKDSAKPKETPQPSEPSEPAVSTTPEAPVPPADTATPAKQAAKDSPAAASVPKSLAWRIGDRLPVSTPPAPRSSQSSNGSSNSSDSESEHDTPASKSMAAIAPKGTPGTPDTPFYPQTLLQKAAARARRPGSRLSVSDAVIETGDSSSDSSDDESASASDSDSDSDSDSGSESSSSSSSSSVASNVDPADLLNQIMTKPLSKSQRKQARRSAASMHQVEAVEASDIEDSDQEHEVPQRSQARRGSDSSIGDFNDGSVSGERSEDDSDAEANRSRAALLDAVAEATKEDDAMDVDEEVQSSHLDLMATPQATKAVQPSSARSFDSRRSFNRLAASSPIPFDTPGDIALREAIEEDGPLDQLMDDEDYSDLAPTAVVAETAGSEFIPTQIVAEELESQPQSPVKQPRSSKKVVAESSAEDDTSAMVETPARRGRPPKRVPAEGTVSSQALPSSQPASTQPLAESSQAATPVKRGPGRPRKSVPAEATAAQTEAPASQPQPNATTVEAQPTPQPAKKGRPRKNPLPEPSQEEATAASSAAPVSESQMEPSQAVKRGPGRPRKSIPATEAEVPVAAEPPASQPEPSASQPAKRGRPRKNSVVEPPASQPVRRSTRAASREPALPASQPAPRTTRAASREPPATQPARRVTRASSREPSVPPPSQRSTRAASREPPVTQRSTRKSTRASQSPVKKTTALAAHSEEDEDIVVSPKPSGRAKVSNEGPSEIDELDSSFPSQLNSPIFPPSSLPNGFPDEPSSSVAASLQAESASPSPQTQSSPLRRRNSNDTPLFQTQGSQPMATQHYESMPPPLVPETQENGHSRSPSLASLPNGDYDSDDEATSKMYPPLSLTQPSQQSAQTPSFPTLTSLSKEFLRRGGSMGSSIVGKVRDTFSGNAVSRPKDESDSDDSSTAGDSSEEEEAVPDAVRERYAGGARRRKPRLTGGAMPGW